MALKNCIFNNQKKMLILSRVFDFFIFFSYNSMLPYAIYIHMTCLFSLLGWLLRKIMAPFKDTCMKVGNDSQWWCTESTSLNFKDAKQKSLNDTWMCKNNCHRLTCEGLSKHYNYDCLTFTVLVTTIDAQWEGMGDVGSARYEPALLPPYPTIRVLSYSYW